MFSPEDLILTSRQKLVHNRLSQLELLLQIGQSVMNFINAIKGETNNFLLGILTAFTLIQILTNPKVIK